MFENIRQDLKAHNGKWSSQGFWVLVVYRFGRWRYGIRPALLRKPFSLLYKILFKQTQILTGVELPCEVEIGPNFVIDHFGGIVVHGATKFGRNCRIRTGVVIGVKRAGDIGAAIIGDDVDLGTGAAILGSIRIGNRVLIGANAVVRQDIPDDSIVFGNPAIIKPRREEPHD